MRTLLTTMMLIAFVTFSALSEDHTISITGLSYTPANLEVQIGDNVTIEATGLHPTTQVSQSTWDANESTPLGGGFVGEVSSFSFTITSTSTIYYVCENHIDTGMKGQITVVTATGLEESLNRIGFQVMNNPASNTLVYQSDETEFILSDIHFYDLKGMELMSRQLSAPTGSISIDLPSGHYLYMVRSREDEVLAAGRVIIGR